MDGRLLQHAREHGRDRALAVRARDMDRAVTVLRIAEELEEPPDPREAEPHAEDTQPIEIGEAFGVIHTPASITAS